MVVASNGNLGSVSFFQRFLDVIKRVSLRIRRHNAGIGEGLIRMLARAIPFTFPLFWEIHEQT